MGADHAHFAHDLVAKGGCPSNAAPSQGDI